MDKKKCMLLLCIPIFIVACTKDNNRNNVVQKAEKSDGKQKEQGYEPFKQYSLRDEDKEFVYHIYKQKLGIYDKSKNVWTPIRDIDNEFFYNFNENREYFTVGHSINNKFSVVKLENNQIKQVRCEDDDDCIFPLASDNEHYYFQECVDEHKEKEKRRILEYKQGKFTTLLETENLISYGVKIKNNLYYSVYVEEDDLYNIYCLDLSKDKKVPEMVKKGITDGKLLAYEDELFYINKDLICSDQNKATFKKKDYNDINSESALLVQMQSNKNGDLQWDFIDMKSKKIVFSYINIIDYKIEGNNIDVYCDGEINHEKVR